MTTLQHLVLTYFRGVDEQDINAILETLHSDCVFSVETHQVDLKGHAHIAKMFERLWSDHISVLHDQFHFVDAGNGTGIAVRFKVTNTCHDNRLVMKSNCNFFTVKGSSFDSIRVYMSGKNTLKK